MADEIKDNAGVVAPPPLIFLSGLIPGGIIQWFYPLRIFPLEYLTILRIAGIALIVFGFGIVLIARAKMQKAETNIEPWKPTNAVISDGIYAVSRNPIYVAMVFIYLGATLIFNALWLLTFLILVLFTIHFGVILREEKYLENKFGAEYLEYKTRVRRWI